MRIYSKTIGLTLASLCLLSACSGKHGEAAGDAAVAAPAGGAALASAKTPRPGLWETTVTSDGMPKPMKAQMCVGAPAPGANPFAPPPHAGQDCSKTAVTKTGTGYAIDIECKMNGMTMSAKGNVSGDFSSSYKTTMTTKMVGPNIPAEMQVGRSSTAESKYLGPCPADMKPGTAKQVG